MGNETYFKYENQNSIEPTYVIDHYCFLAGNQLYHYFEDEYKKKFFEDKVSDHFMQIFAYYTHLITVVHCTVLYCTVYYISVFLTLLLL